MLLEPDAASPGIDRTNGLQPRAQGRAFIVARTREGRTRLERLYQQGSAKCLLPRVAHGMEAVLLNTAGGITGGDHLAYGAEVREGASLTLTTQAAERIYRAQPGTVGRIESRLTIGPGARIDWLPQETILFDRASLRRSLDVDMAPDATLLAVEPLILGRQAMGERITRAGLADHWRIRRGGRLVYADSLRLVGPVADLAARPALLGPNRAAASLVYVAPDAEARLAAARALLPAEGAGASAWNGLLSVRLVCGDGAALRSALIRFLTGFRAAPLPRVWSL